jgi:hypothetical protein
MAECCCRYGTLPLSGVEDFFERGYSLIRFDNVMVFGQGIYANNLSLGIGSLLIKLNDNREAVHITVSMPSIPLPIRSSATYSIKKNRHKNSRLEKSKRESGLWQIAVANPPYGSKSDLLSHLFHLLPQQPLFWQTHRFIHTTQGSFVNFTGQIIQPALTDRHRIIG